MKRFTVLSLCALLLGGLLSLAPPARAQGNVYNLYLVPITPLNKPVAQGSTVQFAVMIDVPQGADPITLTVGASVGYDKGVFDINAVAAAADVSPFAPKPSVKLWDLTPPVQLSATADGTATLQLGVGHTRQSLTQGGATLTVPPGTYTIGTYSFPVRSDAATQTTTISLPSAFGKTGPLAAIDLLGAIDSAGTDRSTFAFPNSAGKYSSLTYSIGNIYSLYLVPITPLDKPVANGSTVQFAAMIDVPQGADPITLTVGASVGYNKNVFDMNTISAVADTSPFAPKPSVKLWDLTPPVELSATTDGTPTLQLGVGHTRQSLQPGGQTLTIPPGTYTIGTYSFPVRADASAQAATISLPTALGKTGPLAAIDFLGSIDSAGTDHSAVTFPNGNGKYSQLTYNIAGPPAPNVYSLYLVPITPLDKPVLQGSTVQFAAMIDVPQGADPITLTVGSSVGYDKNVFDMNAISAAADTTPFAPKPSVKLWDLSPPVQLSATTDGIPTLQLGVGHTRQSLQPGGQTLTIPPGTYTIGTYSFPVRSDATAQTTTIILPTAFGKTGPLSAIDLLGAIDSSGTDRSTFAFPTGSGKYSSLTYTVGNIYSLYLVPITPLDKPVANGSTVQFAAMIDVPQDANPITLTVGASVGYNKNVFDMNTISAVADISPFAPKPSVKLWDLTPPVELSATADGTPTLQLGVGHTRQSLQPGGQTLTIPPGTYTIGTYSFPVRMDAKAQTTTIILPTALGKTGPLTAIDFLGSIDSSGTDRSAVTFPNSSGKYSSLTYNIIGPPPIPINGQIALQGLSHTAPAQPVTLTFRSQTGGADITRMVSVDAFGDFSVTVPADNYIVHVASRKYLAVNVTVNAAGQPGFTFTTTLPAGDASGDNKIDITDFGALVNAYGSSVDDAASGYDFNTDFTVDGFVDSTDLALLILNYNRKGAL